MNVALWQAHLENVELRRQLRNLSATRRGRRRCIYCGGPTDSLLRACQAHRDLPALDPGYAAMKERTFAERADAPEPLRAWRPMPARAKVAG